MAAAAAAWQAHHEHLVRQAESARQDGQRALQALMQQHQAQQDALQVRPSRALGNAVRPAPPLVIPCSTCRSVFLGMQRDGAEERIRMADRLQCLSEQQQTRLKDVQVMASHRCLH